jgi:hypothetical protein
MEITDEIKAKVFAQYLGQYMTYPVDVRFTEWGIGSNGTITDLKGGLYNPDLCRLSLKPLTSITDEDIGGVIKIEFGQGDSPTIFRVKDTTAIRFNVNGIEKRILFQRYCNNDPIESNTPLKRTLAIYQYLQSKGYDVPQWLLGWKTLHGAGLAIYESEK